MQQTVDVNAQGGIYGNALQAASVGGHEKVVKMLLDARTDVDAKGGIYGTALYAGSAGDHETAVKMLLLTEANVNAQGGRYGNALQAASVRSCDGVVRMLMDAGAKLLRYVAYNSADFVSLKDRVASDFGMRRKPIRTKWTT